MLLFRSASLRLAAVVLAAAVSGCAHYHPDPPRAASELFAAPDTSGLSVAAQSIDRPFLAAQSIDLSAPLTLNALAVITVLESPELKALRAKTGVSDAQAFSARLLPDPTTQFGYDQRLSGPDPFNGLAAQLGFDLNQLRLSRVTREAGEASKRQVRLDVAWAEWQAAGQARLLGVRIVALTTAAELSRASAEQATRLLDTALRAAGRGDLAGAELDIRRQAAIDAADKARTAESALVAARGDLNKQLGLPPTSRLIIAGPPAPPPLPAAETLVALALDRRLDLGALRAGYQAQEAETHKQVLLQFPTLSLTLSGVKDTAANYTLGHRSASPCRCGTGTAAVSPSPTRPGRSSRPSTRRGCSRRVPTSSMRSITSRPPAGSGPPSPKRFRRCSAMPRRRSALVTGAISRARPAKRRRRRCATAHWRWLSSTNRSPSKRSPSNC